MKHVLVVRILTLVQMLVQADVLQVVFILLLRAQREFGALVELVGVAFARDVHHDQVFAVVVKLSSLNGCPNLTFVVST